MSADIGWAGMAISLVLVVVAIALSWWRRLSLERSLAWSATRALAQLLAVGAVLDLILEPGTSLGWAWLWVVGMVGVAAAVVAWRSRGVPGIVGLALAAFAAAVSVSLGVLFGLGIFELESRTLIPLAGLTIGNSMAATILVAGRVYEELRDKRDEVEARLALGQPSNDAARPYLRAALRTALVPQIEQTKAVGLVALPGAMTGLLLAGVEPLDAVRVQAAVMFLVLGAVATTTVVVGLGVTKRLFTPDHRLVALDRPAEG